MRLLNYLNNPEQKGSKYLPLFITLGGTCFRDFLFSGEFDWTLQELIESPEIGPVKPVICEYLKSRLVSVRDSEQPVSTSE